MRHAWQPMRALLTRARDCTDCIAYRIAYSSLLTSMALRYIAYIIYINYTNGYRKNRPQFKVEFKGVEVKDEVNEVYSNGFRVNYPYKKEGYYKIILGGISV